MIYTIENITGRIAQRTDDFDKHAPHYERKGCQVIVTDLVVSPSTHYVANGRFILIPDRPSDYHTWDWGTHTWGRDRALAERVVRAKRDGLLRNVVDTINAVRWAAMSESDRASWDAYRTALLDITDQPGFPFEVIWPLAPQ